MPLDRYLAQLTATASGVGSSCEMTPRGFASVSIVKTKLLSAAQLYIGCREEHLQIITLLALVPLFGLFGGDTRRDLRSRVHALTDAVTIFLSLRVASRCIAAALSVVWAPCCARLFVVLWDSFLRGDYRLLQQSMGPHPSILTCALATRARASSPLMAMSARRSQQVKAFGSISVSNLTSLGANLTRWSKTVASRSTASRRTLERVYALVMSSPLMESPWNGSGWHWVEQTLISRT